MADKKIKMLIEGMPIGLGGIGSVIFNLLMHMDLSQYELYFLLTYKSVYEENIKKIGGKIVRMPIFGKNPFAYSAALKQHFKENDYDIVWVNNTSKVNIYIFKYAKKYTHAKTIAHSHGEGAEGMVFKRILSGLISKIHERTFYRNMDYALSCSENSAKYFYNPKKLTGKNVRIIRNGTDIQKYIFDEATRRNVRDRLGIGKDEVLIGTVGRVSEVKNQVLLIDMLMFLDDRYRVAIVGKGNLCKELEAHAVECKVGDRVAFLGNRDDVPDVMCAFDVFCLPSKHEGMPLVLVEAQISDLPCIVSNSVSIDADIVGKTCFLPLVPKEWAITIGNLERKPRLSNPDIIRQAGYDISDIASDFHEFLNSIC